MEFEKVALSKNDLNRKITIPTSPTPELAEIIGILSGDGFVAKPENFPTNRREYAIEIAGHAKEELDYLESVHKLMKFIFNVEMKLHIRNSINTAYLIIRSKGIVTFLKTNGYEKNKCIIKTPSWVWQEDNYIVRFIRGLFDTD